MTKATKEEASAGGVVAWRHVYFRDGKRIGNGPWRDIGERINEQQGDDIEYAYTQPPATVPADAVLALVADLRTEGQREKDDMRDRVRDRAYEKLDLANRLEALTRGEGNAEVARLRQALQDVADPIGYLRREAEAKGERLGGMAYSIANDLHFVKQIASRALTAAGVDKPQEEE